MKSKVDIAKETAEKVHGSQTDKKNFPYIAHVNDVAKRVQQLGDDYFCRLSDFNFDKSYSWGVSLFVNKSLLFLSLRGTQSSFDIFFGSPLKQFKISQLGLLMTL